MIKSEPISDEAIYNQIASILYSFANDEITKINMLVKISEDNLHYKSQIAAYDTHKRDINLDISWSATDEIHLLLIQLKNYFIDHDLTNHMPVWKYCWAEIDIVNNKVNFDFAYDEDNREDKFKFSYE